MLKAAFALEGIGILIILACGIIWLVGKIRKYKNPELRNNLITGFIIGQASFDMGIMFHLGYLTALTT